MRSDGWYRKQILIDMARSVILRESTHINRRTLKPTQQSCQIGKFLIEINRLCIKFLIVGFS